MPGLVCCSPFTLRGVSALCKSGITSLLILLLLFWSSHKHRMIIKLMKYTGTGGSKQDTEIITWFCIFGEETLESNMSQEVKIGSKNIAVAKTHTIRKDFFNLTPFQNSELNVLSVRSRELPKRSQCLKYSGLIFPSVQVQPQRRKLVFVLMGAVVIPPKEL